MFVVYAVCVNKSFVLPFLRTFFFIATTFLRCFVLAKCLAAAATAVAMISDKDDEAARAPPRAEPLNKRAHRTALASYEQKRRSFLHFCGIQAKTFVSQKHFFTCDRLFRIELEQLTAQSVLVFAYSLMLICAALAAERNPISSFHKSSPSMRNGL